MHWKKWLAAAGVRALRTVAQTAAGMISAGALLSDIHWLAVASASALAGIYALLMALAGLPELDAEQEG